MNIKQLKIDFPLIEALQSEEEMIWINPDLNEKISKESLTYEDIKEAEARLDRFAPFIEAAFPETQGTKGIIESPLTKVTNMQAQLEAYGYQTLKGALYLKKDSDLPISGSIKARGGIYEVLAFAEQLALKNKLLKLTDNYICFESEPFKSLFKSHRIAVGSTGNLGLSIGIISAKLGFQVEVHMSSDAKGWKKDLLREKGVTVVEYEEDYSVAVERARDIAKQDDKTYFIDDENSKTLFLGYSVAALRLKKQLEEMDITVDESHPLFVYLPCGVGGGPGGVAFGLKALYKDHVHCFFAEPTKAPCMTLGMMTGLNNTISVGDIGIQMATIADGLAVGRASGFVGTFMKNKMDGCYTVSDETLYKHQYLLHTSENIKVEPSAAAGFSGYYWTNDLQVPHLENACHIVWGTGGSMVPDSVYKSDLEKGQMYL